MIESSDRQDKNKVNGDFWAYSVKQKTKMNSMPFIVKLLGVFET